MSEVLSLPSISVDPVPIICKSGHVDSLHTTRKIVGQFLWRNVAYDRACSSPDVFPVDERYLDEVALI